MSSGEPASPATAAEQRIRQALSERDEEIELAHRRFWTRVGSEIAAGQISQAHVAQVLDVTRETLRQRTRRYVPGAPTTRPRAWTPLYLAVGMRLRGEAGWRAMAEPCNGLPVVSMLMGGGSSPYAGHWVEYAYREVGEPPSHNRGYPPVFSAPGLSPRPLFFSEEVDDELFGPAYAGGSAYQAWQKRVSELEPPAAGPTT